MEKDVRPIMVSIRCTVYNHEPYLRDCLEGFVTQKTNFRFEAIVHDDASTDNSAAIIREYAEKYPDIIKPIYETENQYSKRDGSLTRIMDEHTHGKYIALCEGDDYWIDSNKLQMQVDFLEENSDYTMCWTDAYELNCQTNEKRAYNRYNYNCQSPLEDIIVGGGLFIPTASILMRTSLYKKKPQNIIWFDYSLQVYMSYVGKSYYLASQTCVYRLLSVGSWTSRKVKQAYRQNLKNYNDEKLILDQLNSLLKFQYNESFERRMAVILFQYTLNLKLYDEAKTYLALRNKYGIKTRWVDKLIIYDHPVLLKILLKLIRIKQAMLCQ